jgi:NADH dehydrogenase [ubiquinone] 1 alpha subcomplex assembly factor 7
MPQNPLAELIQKRIAARGPIGVAEYMELALAHPEYGYYMRKDPLGVSGDFTTAPEISQVFGELVGVWLAQQWMGIGKPECALVELGPGRGTLMNDLLRATKHIQGFHDAISVHLVETSPVLQQKQWTLLANKHPRISWHKEFSEIPQKSLLLVANEFFDALPVRQFIGNEERKIGMSDRGLAWIPASAEVTKEVCEPAQAIMGEIAMRIATYNGAALIIDYGYAEGSGDTLQALRDHQYHDPLADPGLADLTAHVDFAALKKAAESVLTYGPVPQGAFLMHMGVAERTSMLAQNADDAQVKELYAGVRRLTDPKHMGELFKVLCVVANHMPKSEIF